MVRDPCNRFTVNASFVTLVEKTRGPAVSDGQVNHETHMTNRATVEPSNVLRDSRATHYPVKLPAPGKMPQLFFSKNRASSTFNVSLPISSINFPGTTETRMIAQAPCIKTGMK